MHSKSDNTEIMITDEADGIIEELFDSLKNRYQNNLQLMRSRCYVHLLYYKCHRTNFNRGGSCIDSSDCIKNKKATINPINRKDKCFQYAVTVTLNYAEIKKTTKNLQRITKIKPFINNYNWEGTHFPSEKDDREKFEKNNVTIALNDAPKDAKNEKIYNSNLEKQGILLMISNREKQWHYLAGKGFSTLLRGITSKNNGDFYCLNCLHSFRTKNKLKPHKRACENKDFCNVNMPSDDTKIVEFSQYQKSVTAPFIFYADLEGIKEKTDRCKNNPENSSTAKVSKDIPSGFSMSTMSSFISIENKNDVYRGKDCMKRFCEFLKEHTMKIINFKKNKNQVINKRAAAII